MEQDLSWVDGKAHLEKGFVFLNCILKLYSLMMLDN